MQHKNATAKKPQKLALNKKTVTLLNQGSLSADNGTLITDLGDGITKTSTFPTCKWRVR